MNNQDQALAKIHAYLDRVQPGQLAVLCGTAAAASESVTEGDLPYASPNQKSELCPEHYKPEVLALGWVFLQWICENRAEVNNLN